MRRMSASRRAAALAVAAVALGAAAAAIALVNSFGNLGGFVGPYVTGVLRDATGDFATGLVAIAALLLVGVLLALSFRNTAADPAGFGSNERSAGSGADR